MTRDEVDKVIAQLLPGKQPFPANSTGEGTRFRAALEAQGMVIVPREPTPEMLKAGRARRIQSGGIAPEWIAAHGFAPAWTIYRAMTEAYNG